MGKRMAIPNNITKDDVLAAMARIDPDPSKGPYRFQSTGYDVVHPTTGERFPPKLGVSEAAQIATGEELSRHPRKSGRYFEPSFSRCRLVIFGAGA
jgi:hypothetical protein